MLICAHKAVCVKCYRCEIGGEECLLETRPQSQRDDEQLDWIGQLF